MSTENLLVEIRTEELPPQILKMLAEGFKHSLLRALAKAEFVDEETVWLDDDKNYRFATPRRLAVLLIDVRTESPMREVVRRGPQIDACRDVDGMPTKALVGFMHSVGVTCESDLTEIVEKEKRYVAWEGKMAGRKLADDLAPMVEKVLLNLSAPRLMRWGENEFRFVRPVHGVLMMQGKKVIGGTVMNVVADKTTKGHPILSTSEIAIDNADDYEKTMREKGMVIVDENVRREEIENQLREVAKEKNWLINLQSSEPAKNVGFFRLLRWLLKNSSKTKDMVDEAGATRWMNWLTENPSVITEELYDDHESDERLLDEVTGMCEYPAVYTGEMRGAESLPDFCVISCMKKHQRFFPAYDTEGKLNLAHYFVVTDNKPVNPAPMIAGFDSVLRARLRDLSFYYTEDKKHSVEYYLERLKGVVYHGKLGTQHDRVCRLQTIARGIAKLMGLDSEQKKLLEESVALCKADLTTLVVGEYPDMEGIIAAEYFCTGKTAEIVRWHNALPRSGKKLSAYYALLLADNLEKLVGLFGIGEKPTGSKDPHGLRSAAMNVMLVLRDDKQQLAGDKLLQTAAAAFDELPHFDLQEVWSFIVTRLPMLSGNITADDIRNAGWQVQIGIELQKTVLAQDNFFLADIYSRQQSIMKFRGFSEAEILVDAGKRINNIFRKSGVESDSFSAPDVGLFEHDAERALHDAVIKLTADTNKQTNEGDYVSALKTLALAAKPIDEFFDKVMVNAEDEKIRHNRFALLHELRALLNCVVKLS